MPHPLPLTIVQFIHGFTASFVDILQSFLTNLICYNLRKSSFKFYYISGWLWPGIETILIRRFGLSWDLHYHFRLLSSLCIRERWPWLSLLTSTTTERSTVQHYVGALWNPQVLKKLSNLFLCFWLGLSLVLTGQ